MLKTITIAIAAGLVPASCGSAAKTAATGSVRYVSNLGATPKLSSAALLQKLKLSTGGPLVVQSVVTKRFGDVDPIAKGQINLLTVSPDRTVYEVKTAFSAPYTIRGNTWSSGRRTFVVDAETGDVLLGQTNGALVRSVHVDTLHHTSPPARGVSLRRRSVRRSPCAGASGRSPARW